MLAIFGVGQVLWSFLVFFLWIIWIFLAITVFVDIFRSHDLSGVAKALWVVFILLVPYLGVFVYLLFRGGSMHERAVQAAQSADQVLRDYVREAAGGGDVRSAAGELSRLADLKDRGALSEDEFQRLKAKVVG